MEQLNQWNSVSGLVTAAITILIFVYGFFKWFPAVENRLGNLEKGQDEFKVGQQELKHDLNKRMDELKHDLNKRMDSLETKIDDSRRDNDLRFRDIDNKFNDIMKLLLQQQIQADMVNKVGQRVEQVLAEKEKEKQKL